MSNLLSADPLPDHDTHSGPQLLVTWRPRLEEFRENLTYARDSFLHPTPAPFAPGELPKNWRDVFVDRSFPWFPFRHSVLAHAALAFLLVSFSHLWMRFERSQLDESMRKKTVHYDLSEYIPVFEHPAPAPKPMVGEPAHARQRIVSTPPKPDNSEQTIVIPTRPEKIFKTVPLPDLAVNVAAPLPPMPDLERAKPIIAPEITSTVIAPVPVAQREALRKIPKVEYDPIRPMAEPVQAELAHAPLLVVDPIRPLPDPEREKMTKKNLDIAAAVKPPPSKPAPQGDDDHIAEFDSFADRKLLEQWQAKPADSAPANNSAAKKPQGQLLAIQLHPSDPQKQIPVPEGSRSGIFAATPEGKPGAPGTPDVRPSNTTANGSGSNARNNPNDPYAGISISGPAKATSSAVAVKPVDESTSRKRDVGPSKLPSEDDNLPSSPTQDFDKEVFGVRKYYSVSINLPNLNSAGGSWIIHFAEKNNENGTTPANVTPLTSPVAVLKTDPAYPMELITDRIEGTVTLYAIIRADGSVSDIRLLHGFNHQLDENAQTALAKWRFRPAEKNGVPIDLEAVVQIPFKVRKLRY